MASDIADVLGQAIGKVAREAAKSVSPGNGKPHGNVADRVSDALSGRMKNVSGSKGLAAGVGIAAAAPLAAKGVGKLARGITNSGDGVVKKAGEKLGESAGEAAKSKIPGMGGKSKGVPGVGKGRRMPVQQDIDIGAPLDMVYKHWVDYEEWPTFMHRLDNVSQDDDEHIKFKTKIWGMSREFSAEVVEHEPRERIKWEVTDGVTHTGVVTFHELGPRLTRVEVNLDVEPGSLIEKAARGMRHVKRAVRADLARFKAYVLMQEPESPGGGDSSSSATPSRERSSSSGRGNASSRGRSSSSSRGRSSSSSRKQSSSSGSGSGRKRTTASSNDRSSSSRTRASSNGRSSNSQSRSSSRKRAGSRS